MTDASDIADVRKRLRQIVVVTGNDGAELSRGYVNPAGHDADKLIEGLLNAAAARNILIDTYERRHAEQEARIAALIQAADAGDSLMHEYEATLFRIRDAAYSHADQARRWAAGVLFRKAAAPPATPDQEGK